LSGRRARLAIDIGGTFTDLILQEADGAQWTLKVPSTPDDYSRAIALGVAELLRRAGLPGEDVEQVLHATTIASNAIVEAKGARTGLITTCGFRDILELRTLRMPRLYDLTWTKPPVLVERALRTEVLERVDFRGQVQIPLDEASVERAITILLDAGVTSIAVCLLHAYANDRHERRIGELIARRAPDISVSLSADVLPEIREYERTSTTVINAYVRPVVSRYVIQLGEQLRVHQVRSPLLLMQSSGGLMPAEEAANLPVHIVESGPAAGVVGALSLAAELNEPNLISFDMGGTTAKAALIEGGVASQASELQIGGGIMTGSRLLTGSGYTLRLPAIDLAEVGAGGGSIVWLDRGGSPQVGPESAGAVPGPACYGMGGSEPTVTDCAVVLGYISPTELAGGAVRLQPEKARAALEQRIARPMHISVEQAAFGAMQIATSSMIRAIRAVSSERGRDPRDFALAAFGGNGGLFGPLVARALGLARVIVPPSPGLFSARGLLDGVVEQHFSHTLKSLLHDIDLGAVEALLARMEAMAGARLAGAEMIRSARMRYHGQSFELTVMLPDRPLTEADRAALEEAFGREHERVYGHRAGADEPVENVSLRLVARQRRGARPIGRPAEAAPGSAVRRGRRVYFGADHGWLEVPLLTRADLLSPGAGPMLIEEYDSTILVPIGARAVCTPSGGLVVDL
jgi:N-methylhydantoinase A